MVAKKILLQLLEEKGREETTSIRKAAMKSGNTTAVLAAATLNVKAAEKRR